MKTKINTILLKIGLTIFVGLISSFGMTQTIQVTLPDTLIHRGSEILFPVKVSGLTGDMEVISGQFSITTHATDLQIIGIETENTFLSGKQVVLNSVSRQFAFSSTEAIVGNGILIYLKILVSAQPSSMNYGITLSNLKFNEGNPPHTLTAGFIRIKNISISPKVIPQNFVVGDSLQFTVTGQVTGNLSYFSRQPGIVSISPTGKMKGLSVGTTRIIVTDESGLKDSTDLFGIHSSTLKSLTIGLRDTTYLQTLEFDWPVTISEVTGLEISSAEFTLNFNSNYLQAVGVRTQGSLSEGWLASHVKSAGKIEVSMAGANELSGSGTLVYIRFKVLRLNIVQTNVAFSGVLFNETILANTITGKFIPISAPVVVISPNSATISKGDSLQFQVTSGGTPPFRWHSSNTVVASIDSLTGLFVAHSQGQVVVTVKDQLGFEGQTAQIVVNSIDIRIPIVQVEVGDSISVPVLSDLLDGLDIFSIESKIVFDSTLVEFLGFETSETLTQGQQIVYTVKNGEIILAIASSQALSGEGAVFKLKFKPIGTESANQNSPLQMLYFRMNEVGQDAPLATIYHGVIQIKSKLSLPSKVVLLTPEPNTIIAQPQVTLEWNSSQPEITFYHIEYGFSDSLISDSTLTDVSLFLDAIENNVTYHWKVRAKNNSGWGEWSDSWEFNVAYDGTSVDENQPHAFILHQNYPNPFNPSTVIRFQSQYSTHVQIKVFDLMGKEMVLLLNEYKEAGNYQVEFNATDLPSGVYFYQIISGSFIQTKKMILMK